jgi:uncharacterized pyridoxamine 5'-phosphate oxidase family protein
MKNFTEILKTNPVGVFATQDGNKVKTRVFQYLFADGNKIYFGTNSKKPVYSQIENNPNVSFCTYPQNYAPVLSVNGKAVFVEDLALKTKVLEENPHVKGMYKTPDNPLFKLFYIDVEEVQTFSRDEGPKTYNV